MSAPRRPIRRRPSTILLKDLDARRPVRGGSSKRLFGESAGHDAAADAEAVRVPDRARGPRVKRR